MFQNYLTTAWRNIIKNGLFSAINIFGLAIGLMSCILILLFVRDESGFDQWIPEHNKLVRLHTAYIVPDRPEFLTVRSAGMMMEAIRDYARNEVEEGVRLIPWGLTVRQQDKAFAETVTLVDADFFKVFDLPFIHGSKDSSFTKPNDLVVTEEMARKYFGRTDVIGETITLCCFEDNTITLGITGVVKNLPSATHLDLDLIVRINPAAFENIPGILDTWTSVNVYTYFKLRDDVSIEQLQERITYWVDNESHFVEMHADHASLSSNTEKVSDEIKHKLMAVTDLHLDARKDAGSMGDFTPMGDRQMINTFTFVSLLILLIACINFMNLATARASQRAREVAMRKVLGASRTQVAIQFLGEAVALVLIALLFALVAVELALPFYNGALGKTLEFRLFDDPLMLCALIGAAVVVGVGAGLYPATYLSRYLPAHILSASKGSESGGTAKLRSALVVFQFAMSIGLVVSTAVIYCQTVFTKSINVGYESDNKLVLNVRSAGNVLDPLQRALEKIPEISSVVYSSEAPTQDNENNNLFKLLESSDANAAEPSQLMNYHTMGYGFFEAYKIEPLAGRLFNEKYGTDQVSPKPKTEGLNGSGGVILNLSGIKKYGFTEPQDAIGKTLQVKILDGVRHDLTIVGVIPDIYFRSVKFGVRPSVYVLNPQRFRVASLTFNTDNLPALLAKVETVWKDMVPLQPMDLSFLSEMMAAQYESEVTQTKLFSAFSLLAILVACLGLFGLAAFTAERRTKEIGIRKIMGAELRDIVTLLVWQFSRPVIIANLIAWPLVFYAMANWLEAFPYRMDMWWILPICLATGLVSLMIAWLTVGGNALKVARANPMYALRHDG